MIERDREFMGHYLSRFQVKVCRGKQYNYTGLVILLMRQRARLNDGQMHDLREGDDVEELAPFNRHQL